MAKAVLGKVPLLETKEKKYLNSFNAIVKYVCMKADFPLKGQTDFDTCMFDECIELVTSHRKEYNEMLQKVEQKDESVKKLTLNEDIEKTLKLLDKILNFSAFIGGNKLCYADFIVYFFLSQTLSLFGQKALANYHNCMRLVSFIENSGL